MDLKNRKFFLYISVTISIVVLLILVVLFIVAQLYIRTSKERELRYVGDAFINFILDPNQSVFPGKGWFHQDDRQFHINNLGLRGSDFFKKSDPGTFRIAVLGGSSVFDMLVSDDQIFTVKLQEMLRKQTEKKIEVINCGIPGWSTVHSLVNYIFRIRYLKPDLIIIYHTWNDIKYFKYLHDGFDMPKYFRVYNNRRQRHLLGKFPFSQIDALKTMFTSAMAKLKGKTVIENEGNPFMEKKNKTEKEYDTTIFEKCLMDLVYLAKLDGCSVLLCTQANLAYENTAKEDRDKIFYNYVNTDHNGLVRAINLANDVIFRVSRKEKVPFVDVYNSMLGMSDCFVDHVHLTAKGGDKLAELLSNKIIKNNLNKTNQILEW